MDWTQVLDKVADWLTLRGEGHLRFLAPEKAALYQELHENGRVGCFGVRVFLNEVASRVPDPTMKLGLLQIASLPDQAMCQSAAFQALVGDGDATASTVSRVDFSHNLRYFVDHVARATWNPDSCAPPRVQSPRRTREVQQQQQQQQQHAESREGGQEQAQSPVKHRPRGSSIPVYRPQGGVLSPRQPVVHHHGGADAMAPKRDDEPPVSQKQNQPVKAVASPLQSPRETLRSPRAQARITTDKPATSPRVSTVAWARESTIPSVGGRGRGATKKPRKPRMSSISHAAAAASSSGVHQSKLPPPPGAHSPRGREGGEVHRPSERGRSMKSPRFTSAAGGKRGRAAPATLSPAPSPPKFRSQEEIDRELDRELEEELADMHARQQHAVAMVEARKREVPQLQQGGGGQEKPVGPRGGRKRMSGVSVAGGMGQTPPLHSDLQKALFLDLKRLSGGQQGNEEEVVVVERPAVPFKGGHKVGGAPDPQRKSGIRASVDDPDDLGGARHALSVGSEPEADLPARNPVLRSDSAVMLLRIETALKKVQRDRVESANHSLQVERASGKEGSWSPAARRPSTVALEDPRVESSKEGQREEQGEAELQHLKSRQSSMRGRLGSGATVQGLSRRDVDSPALADLFGSDMTERVDDISLADLREGTTPFAWVTPTASLDPDQGLGEEPDLRDSEPAGVLKEPLTASSSRQEDSSSEAMSLFSSDEMASQQGEEELDAPNEGVRDPVAEHTVPPVRGEEEKVEWKSSTDPQSPPFLGTHQVGGKSIKDLQQIYGSYDDIPLPITSPAGGGAILEAEHKHSDAGSPRQAEAAPRRTGSGSGSGSSFSRLPVLRTQSQKQGLRVPANASKGMDMETKIPPNDSAVLSPSRTLPAFSHLLPDVRTATQGSVPAGENQQPSDISGHINSSNSRIRKLSTTISTGGDSVDDRPLLAENQRAVSQRWLRLAEVEEWRERQRLQERKDEMAHRELEMRAERLRMEAEALSPSSRAVSREIPVRKRSPTQGQSVEPAQGLTPSQARETNRQRIQRLAQEVKQRLVTQREILGIVDHASTDQGASSVSSNQVCVQDPDQAADSHHLRLPEVQEMSFPSCVLFTHATTGGGSGGSAPFSWRQVLSDKSSATAVETPMRVHFLCEFQFSAPQRAVEMEDLPNFFPVVVPNPSGEPVACLPLWHLAKGEGEKVADWCGVLAPAALQTVEVLQQCARHILLAGFPVSHAVVSSRRTTTSLQELLTSLDTFVNGVVLVSNVPIPSPHGIHPSMWIMSWWTSLR